MKKEYCLIIVLIFVLTIPFTGELEPINREIIETPKIPEIEVDRMGNNKSYKFTDLGITSAKLPANTHLLIELNNGTLYIVPSTETDSWYKSINKSDSWSKINDTDNNNEIRSAFYDKTNNRLYYCEGDSGELNAYWRYIDLTDDSVTTIYSPIVVSFNYRTGLDVIIDGATTYCIFSVEVAPDNLHMYVYDLGTAWHNNIGTIGGRDYDYSYFVDDGGSYMWFLFEWQTGTDDGTTVWRWTKGTHTFTKFANAGATMELPSKNQRSIAYDGSNTLYFVLKDTSDSKYYLHSYSITGDSITKLSEYNIALMLDRNCANTAPNEYEKAFDVAKDANNDSRIWEIKPRKGGLIQLQTINYNANIIGITDNFLMFGGGEMYEYTDILATNTIAEGILKKGIFPITTKGRFNCHPQDADLFYNDDTVKVYDDTDELILFAKITDKSRDQDGISNFGLDAYANELWRRTYDKSHSSDKTSDKLKDNVDNACSFCHRSSSIYSGDATNYSYEQDRPPMAMFDLGRFMERTVGSVSPNGLVRTELYSSLTKAPLYFPGIYNFRDEAVGTSGTDIDFIDSESGGDSNIEVIIVASEDGHKKVLKTSCDGDNGAYALWRHNFTDQPSGTIEILFKYKDNGQGFHDFRLYNESSGLIVYLIVAASNNKIYAYHAATSTNTDISADTWHHIRVKFDCATDHQWVSLAGVSLISDVAFYQSRTCDYGAFYDLRLSNGGGVNALECYWDAFGHSWDANYNIGDNLIAWDVEKNGNIELRDIASKPSYYPKKLGITRATCVGAAGISQTYNDATLEDGKAILPLKEYRDLKIQATTEALQVATALFNVFSSETKFIGIRVVNQEYVRPGNTVNFANTGDITVSEDDYLVLYYEYDWVNDVYNLMVLTDNIVLLREMESYLSRERLMVHQNSTAIREMVNFPIGSICMFSGTWVNNSTIPGWYKCDGNNGTVNLVGKFVRGAATSGATGGSDDAVVVTHSHGIEIINQQHGYSSGDILYDFINDGSSCVGGRVCSEGVSGVGANKPAYYALIFIQRIS